MITVTADRIASIIAADHAMLRQMHAFMEAASFDDADIGAVLNELPAAIAAHSPFEDEGSLTEVVKSELLQALRALALRRLPARGTA
jgi:hypothetical protein